MSKVEVQICDACGSESRESRMFARAFDRTHLDKTNLPTNEIRQMQFRVTTHGNIVIDIEPESQAIRESSDPCLCEDCIARLIRQAANFIHEALIGKSTVCGDRS